MYGIKIYSKKYGQKVNMETVKAQLDGTIIEVDEDHDTIFVEPMDVDDAVVTLNQLGYATDEDENDEE